MQESLGHGLIVVDAISAAKRMGAHVAAFDFLIRLLAACRERGITCFYLNQVPHATAADYISGIGISSLIDTVLVLDYAWSDSKLERSLFVLKSRSARHSLKVHRLTISENGMVIHPPATDGGREDT